MQSTPQYVAQEHAVGMAVLAPNMTITSWNLEAEQITGYSRAAMQRLGLDSLFVPAEVLQHLLHQGQQGVATPSEYLYLSHAAGHLVPVTVQVLPHCRGDQSYRQIDIIFFERGAQQLLMCSKDQCRLLNRLASSLAHEIRNPLSTMALHADLIADTLRRPAADQQADVDVSLAEIRAEIARLEYLVQGYLALARLEHLRREPVDLGALVEDLALSLQEQMALQGITLHLQGVQNLGEVTVHHQTFSQAMHNLLRNAMEAMPQGGALTIRGTRQDTFISLAIQDTGCGMCDEDLPGLFQPFHTTKPEGTGLGLYLVKQIITAHAGETLVTSSNGGGMTFTITLPLA
jgi:two-component system sensor histidine kinase HydH